MARTKSLSARVHRKELKRARGFKNARSSRVKAAKEALLHQGQYAYIGRKLRRRDLRSLWIMRLNAAARENGMKYSQLINKLKENKIELDRKILSDIAINDPEAFKSIVSELK